MEDPELLVAFVERGSEKAFTALVNRYTDLVHSAALRQVRGDIHLARDVAQAVFTDLARRASGLRERRTLTGWLYTSTRYAAVQVLRSESRRLQRETEAHHMNELSSPSMPEEWERVRPVLDDVMGELADDERESILLRYFEGRAYAEIGRTFLISENTARMRVERALDKLHGLLARRGVTSTAGALGVVLAQQAVAAGPTGLAADLAASALAALPAGSGFLAAFLGAKAQVAWVSGVALVCAGVLGYHLHATRQLQSDISRLQGQNAAAMAKLAGDRSELAKRSVERDARARFLAVAADLAPDERAVAQATERRRLVLRTRSAIAPEYAGLLRALRLPPDTRGRFEELLLAKTVNEVVALREFARAAELGSHAMDETALALVKAAATRTIEDEIGAVLGPDRFQAYREYVRTRPIRHQIEQVAAAARHTAEALTDEQVGRLVSLVAEAGGDILQPVPEAVLRRAAERLGAGEQAALARLQILRAARRTILETNRDAAARGLVKLLPLNGLVLDGF
jgi:RNA polymerase sigma factor (sigma-70 family)